MAIRQASRYENGKVVEFETTFEGAVLGTREANFHDDSDFYAIVWDEATQSVRQVLYGTTRFPTYENTASRDATEEVLEKARAWMREWAFGVLRSESADDAGKVEVGKTVEVYKGRKVPVGTVGLVVWKGVNRYQRNRYVTNYRIGLKPEGLDEVLFTAADNVRVVDPQDYLTDDAELVARAVRFENSFSTPGQAYRLSR